jgi:hypothetical protein
MMLISIIAISHVVQPHLELRKCPICYDRRGKVCLFCLLCVGWLLCISALSPGLALKQSNNNDILCVSVYVPDQLNLELKTVVWTQLRSDLVGLIDEV